MTRTLLDTNVILRLLLNDHPTLSGRALDVFRRAERGEQRLVLVPLIVAECCYVLKGPVYRMDRAVIADILIEVLLFEGVECEERGIVVAALQGFGERAIDFADCYLRALSQARSWDIMSFDADVSPSAGT